MKSHTVVRILTRPATLCASLYYNKHECSPNRNLIPECFDIFTGDRFGSGSNCSRSTLHICGGGEKQASPGKAKPLRRIKSSGTLYFSNSGKIMGGDTWVNETYTCFVINIFAMYKFLCSKSMSLNGLSPEGTNH